MRIAVNTRLLIKGKLGGIGWFTYQSLKRITQNHPEHQFYFLFDRDFNNEFIFGDNIIPFKLLPPARHPFLWYFWFEHRVAPFLNKYKPDFFLSPDGYLVLKTNIPSLPVIHDINFVHLSENLPFWAEKYYLHYFPLFAGKAKRIATVSEYSKTDLVNSYNLNSDKIDVVYNGSDSVFQPITKVQQEQIKQKFSNGVDFFIYIGSLHPRKNMCRMLEAFDIFKKQTNLPHKLILIGDPLFNTGGMWKTHSTMKYKDDVLFLGRIPREQAKLVMASARALIFVSYFEGFGIPILEGFRCEIPVLAGNKTSLPEVGGKAAHYVDPFSVKSIASGMIEIEKNDSLRAKLINEGKLQREKFSWDKTAKLLWESVEKTIDSKKSLKQKK
jgi:glycosyltransferase involved in cell wall biosynthesis